jgi:MFS family permease
MTTSAADLRTRREGSGFAYVVLLVISAVDAAGYSIIAPVGPAIARSTGVGPGMIGVLVATFPLGIMAGFVVAAAGVKRGRTSAVLLLSLVMIAAGSLGFVFGSSLGAYFIARLVMGLGSGGVWIGVTFNTLARWPGQEYRCMSRIFAAYSVGGLIGPAFGALGGIARPFAAFGLVVLGCAALAGVMGGSAGTSSGFGSDRSALLLPGFWLASVGNLFAYLALGIIEGVLPIHFGSKLSQAGIGIFYALMSVVVAACAAFAARFSPRRALLSAIALIVIGIAVAGSSSVVPAWVTALVIAGAGFGLAVTGSIGVLLEGVPTERIVTAMVVWSQIGIVGYFLGPLVGGFVAESVGFQALGIVPLLGTIPVVLLALRRVPHRPERG